jgi:hypothetical protein
MRVIVLPLCVVYGCSHEAAEAPVTADAPVGDVSLLQELRYVGEIRQQDLVPGTRSVLTSHEGANGWPLLTLVLDPGPGLSIASISYRNEGLAEEDQAYIDVGKWHYAYDSFQVLDDEALDVEARTFDATMIFVGAQLSRRTGPRSTWSCSTTSSTPPPSSRGPASASSSSATATTAPTRADRRPVLARIVGRPRAPADLAAGRLSPPRSAQG